MPLYEFKCKKCGTKFDVLQKMSDPNPPCPHEVAGDQKCEGETEKLISSSSFQLKGGGWYKDGY